MSIRETIIAAAVTAIDAAVTPAVYRSRTAALTAGQLPAVVVSPLRDTPSDTDSSLCWLNWEMEIAVDVVVAADPPDQAADALVQAAHGALMAGTRTLGINAVTDVGVGNVEFMAEAGGTISGITRCLFLIRYRTQHANLAVAP